MRKAPITVRLNSKESIKHQEAAVILARHRPNQGHELIQNNIPCDCIPVGLRAHRPNCQRVYAEIKAHNNGHVVMVPRSCLEFE